MLSHRTRPRTRSATALTLLALLGSALTGIAAQPAHADTATSVTVDSASSGRVFDGIGAISGGGGNSRLLTDYPAVERNQILDYLFKPGYGADLQVLKVEIGGDTNTTDGAEHSIEHIKGSVNCNAGYEWWLMEQAKARNPDIKLYGLAWGAPSWAGEGGTSLYTSSAITYLTDWLNCAKSNSLDIDYLGVQQNERAFNSTWIKSLRSALDTAGFSSVKTVGGDNFGWSIADSVVSDSTLASAVDVLGSHYPCGYLTAESTCSTTSNALATGKQLWASETGSQDLDTGAIPMARAYNRGYIDAKLTASINWPIVAGIYPQLHFATDGLVRADQPWSGAYDVGASTWVTAQTTEFTQPGWHFADTGSGYLGASRSNGSYVSYIASDHSAWSTVVETVDATASQTLNLSVAGSLPGGTVHVWSTDLSNPRQVSPMTHVTDLTATNGVYSLTLLPGHVYTLTTTTGQQPGTAAGPVRSTLALPYSDSLGGAATGDEPALFSDMNGAFESARCGGGRTGNCLRQTAVGTPVRWTGESYNAPYTLIGAQTWSDYTVAADALLEQSGSVDLIGRAEYQNTNNNGLNAYHLRVSDTGDWSILRSDSSWNFTTLASGTGPTLGTGTWHRLALTMQGSTITASVDGTDLGAVVTDTAYGSGLAGLGVLGHYGAQFENFSVTPGTSTTLSGTYQLVNRKSGDLMDASGAGTADGTPVVQWTSNGGSNQQWKVSLKSDGYYTITGIASGKPLTVPKASPVAGTPTQLWTADSGADQEWSITSYADGYVAVENRASGFLLDVSGGSTSRGAAILQWPATNGTNQQWKLVKVS
ncbi:RICIN domain-containing protein [Streptomyces sp. NPDC101455]|uniref:RICIN domain-containing protein n=1 Tax=Streptomyces sp. NPDC101455 TaxID=3366142 RepID=UPI0038134D1A